MESSAVINCSFICHWESQSTQFAELLKTKMKWTSEQQHDSGTATQIFNVACYGTVYYKYVLSTGGSEFMYPRAGLLAS